MSGGVDSSVAACLLAEQGYDVLGSHMNLVHLDGVDHGCCGPQARADAEAVAHIGGFDFEVVDMSARFQRTVLADFFDEHAAGRTPNPCVRCNEWIKFGAFLERADALGFDVVATGHYARSVRDPRGAWHLLRAVDSAKDQSYVLHALGQPELARSRFPLGHLTKAQTRAHAHRFGLPVAGKPDSQDVCFVPGADHAAFVAEHSPHAAAAGEVIDATTGRVVAQHEGTFRFTVGQRRGLGVSNPSATYVLDVDPAARRVVVGPGELLARAGLHADRVTWVAGAPPPQPVVDAMVRIRARGDDVPAQIRPDGDRAEVEFSSLQRGVAPGQSVVFYRGEELLGGGRIVGSLPPGRRAGAASAGPRTHTA
jgi:tRNA-uridine 2-sulfurtransferase